MNVHRSQGAWKLLHPWALAQSTSRKRVPLAYTTELHKRPPYFQNLKVQ